MRMMLFQQQKRPGVPVRQSELASLVNSAYQGQRKKGLSSLIIAQAQHKFVELLGMEMAMFKLRTGKAATSQEAPSGTHDLGFVYHLLSQCRHAVLSTDAEVC